MVQCWRLDEEQQEIITILLANFHLRIGRAGRRNNRERSKRAQGRACGRTCIRTRRRCGSFGIRKGRIVSCTLRNKRVVWNRTARKGVSEMKIQKTSKK